ncbi:hypothetical protein [Ectopseudomonas mendocina]|uniref:hypothetical protein n=1 Tax=Ectopseudomonas mendocina TaxID=300 RepID=UPI000B248B03|nr:hypothetical protein [Pseudomonas mendocina]VEE15953.1 Uncharacterised protein [Pseudomonas mendocina]
MSDTYRRARQAGLLSNLLAIALLTLPLPTHATSGALPSSITPQVALSTYRS